MKNPLIICCFAICGVWLSSCNKDNEQDENPPANPPTTTGPDISTTFGYGVMNKLKGIWNGPVTSTTPLGGYPEWIVDFRPISSNQISAKNELDTLNDIHMSFFIAKYNNAYKICFRNGGSFGGQKRVSYFLADSVSETGSYAYYRFSEIMVGKNRAYTEVIFSADSLYIKSYTNHYNTLPTSTPHMTWSAKLQDTGSCVNAVTTHNFPQKVMTKDFSTSFTGLSETVFYDTISDVYKESAQPYLGQTTVNYSFLGTYSPVAGNKVFIVITTQPLISGFSIDPAAMKTRSRYVILSADDLSYTFNYMHPGTYYVYALYDSNGDNNFTSGDWVSATNTTFTLNAESSTSVSTMINFTIP